MEPNDPWVSINNARKNMICRLTRHLLLMTLLLHGYAAVAAPLAPNDPSIVGGLVSWHRDAGANYADGVWTSMVGPNMVELGDAEDGSDVFEVPELTTYTPSEGYFDGLSDVSGVLFSADESDMLWAAEVAGGDPFEELTLIGVYQTLSNHSSVRPVGIGSFMEEVNNNAFNLAADASLRYDNGNNQTDPGLHLPDLTYRVGVLSDGLVSDYLDGEIITEEDFPGGSFEGITKNDNLFIGDVRGGLVDGFTGPNAADVIVSEVIVYSAALTEDQVNGIGEWLQLNLVGGDVGDPCDFDGDGSLGLGDINALRDVIIAGSNDSNFDVTGDGAVDLADLAELVNGSDKLNTFFGDANLSLEFNSADFVAVFTTAKYETGQAATWEEGDWNADGLFNSSDFVVAFSDAGYEQGPRQINAVPEPNAIGMLLLGLVGLMRIRRRN